MNTPTHGREGLAALTLACPAIAFAQPPKSFSCRPAKLGMQILYTASRICALSRPDRRRSHRAMKSSKETTTAAFGREPAGSPYVAQYCPGAPNWICRPVQLRDTDLTFAFEAQ